MFDLPTASERFRSAMLIAVGIGAVVVSSTSVLAQTASAFKLDPQGTKAARLGYFPVPVKLMATKPTGVRKEPAYVAVPKYGEFRLGNGPKSVHYLALDEPEKGTWKIYVDLSGDGDLTTGGDGAWSKHNTTPGREMYGVNSYTVRGSWGSAHNETSSGSYGLSFYRFVGRDVIFMYREAARLGSVTVDGKSHKAMLVENDADGIYSKPLKDDGKPVAGEPTRPVWLMIDSKDDGKWDAPIDIRSPFKFGGKLFVAKLAPDGSRLRLAPTKRKPPEVAKEPEAKPLLAAGTTAPDFEAEAWGGGSLHLADYKGKIVVLDFWATWCGPCQLSMPHIEKVYQAFKDKDVVVLGVCVWDDKGAYTKWVPEKQNVYHFKFAFDPAGKSGRSIAGDKFNVSGIPTTYVIDREGKVAAAIVGYDEGDKRVEEALNKLGVTTTE